MPYAYQRAIAAALAERLDAITEENGYAVERTSIVRHVLGSPDDWQHGMIAVRCGPSTRDAEFIGQWPTVRWRQDFFVVVCVRPANESSDSEEWEPIDDDIAEWMHAVAKAIDCEDQLGGIVDEIHVENFDPVIGNDSEYAGFTATLSVAYRTRENDLSLSPTGESESESG